MITFESKFHHDFNRNRTDQDPVSFLKMPYIILRSLSDILNLEKLIRNGCWNLYNAFPELIEKITYFYFLKSINIVSYIH